MHTCFSHKFCQSSLETSTATLNLLKVFGFLMYLDDRQNIIIQNLRPRYLQTVYLRLKNHIKSLEIRLKLRLTLTNF